MLKSPTLPYSHSLQKVFKAQEQALEPAVKHVRLRSKYRIDTFVRLLLTLVIVGFLLGPSTILVAIPGHGKAKITVILGFALVFAALVSVFTIAKRYPSPPKHIPSNRFLALNLKQGTSY